MEKNPNGLPGVKEGGGIPQKKLAQEDPQNFLITNGCLSMQEGMENQGGGEGRAIKIHQSEGT